MVDGHDVAELRDAFVRARVASGRPSVLVARTLKGKGVSFLEDKEGWHGKPVKKGEELQRAVAELGDTNVSHSRSLPRRYPSPARPSGGSLEITPAYTLGQEVATREAYGTALAKLALSCPDVVAIDADTKNSTFAERLKEAAPARFAEGYIAEQNMVGAALGMATEGKIPFASTFACFLTRAYDFIRMAGYSRPPHLVLVGSHAGVSIGEDGPSQMALEDLAMMRALTAATVLYPSDAVCAEKLTAEAAKTPGLVYIRTSRPKTKVLYANDEAFPVGGSKTLRSSERDRATVVAAGVTVFEALAAHDALAKEGIAVRVIDLYSVKPIDADTLAAAAEATKRRGHGRGPQRVRRPGRGRGVGGGRARARGAPGHSRGPALGQAGRADARPRHRRGGHRGDGEAAARTRARRSPAGASLARSGSARPDWHVRTGPRLTNPPERLSLVSRGKRSWRRTRRLPSCSPRSTGSTARPKSWAGRS